jgi:DNA-binding transcriptional MerR regulator
MDEKAPDAFRTISEAAEELDLPQHVLRFWESRFREIKPMKRGGGRRFYRPEDLDLLRGIKYLLYGEGYTIRGVQRILREQSVKFVQAVWEEGATQPEAPDVRDEEAAEAELFERRELLGARLTSLIGRDLNGHSEDHRREPTFASAPEPRIAPADRAMHVSNLEDEEEDEPVPSKAARSNGLSRDQVDALRIVLNDLMECRKLIDAAVTRLE